MKKAAECPAAFSLLVKQALPVIFEQAVEFPAPFVL
jgi:hypothetical protein